MKDVLKQLGLKKRLEKLACESKGSLIVKGVAAESKSFVLRGVPSFWGNPVFVMASDQKEVEKLVEELRFFLKDEVLIFPEFNSEDTEEVRIKKQSDLQNILLVLEKNQSKIIIVKPDDLEISLINPDEFKSNKLTLKLKQNFDQEKLIKFLVKQGHVSQKRIDVVGTFARRGGVVDIYLPNYKFPLRLEFSGDQLESILAINLLTGEIKKKLSKIEIHSLSLSLQKQRSKENQFTILDYCNFQKVLLVSQESTLDICHRTSDICHYLVFDNFPSEDNKNVIDLGFKSVPSYWSQSEILKDDLLAKQKSGWQIFIITKHQKSIISHFKSKTDNLDDRLIIGNETSKPITIESKKIFPIIISESKNELSSFQNPDQKFIYLTDEAIFKKPLGQRSKRRKTSRRVDQAFIMSLKPNDLVVHIDHGIGKFQEMRKRTVEGIEREYFVLAYAGGDKLFVPVDQADRLNNYVGVENPTLNRLSGIAWKQMKSRVKRKARGIARKLLELYAKRELSKGYAFDKDNQMQKELEESFQYQETEDQLSTLAEVKRDMESGQVMDRLICGDVGFGKTEVALRAVFKAVMNGKQAAFLAPTTILVEQHMATFTKRLKNFPIKIDSLSRFKSKSDQKKTIQRLKRGDIDIVIGTHRLIQKDIEFKNLGLVVIDEEQRFGVTHKERFKEMRNKIDILTLSATPIPRTLNLALGGIRSISTITTPPPGRLAVETFVQRYDNDLIKNVIERELKRKGQIYFLHNRVRTIESAAAAIKELVPGAKIVIAHGQMDPKRLEKVMEDFYRGKYNVLVCSSIIENGLDIPNVNTLIVDDAVYFGLSQLYQLRGRIGRSHKQAYSYFLYKEKFLKGLARRRLTALLEAQKLGSGFEVAMRDLEIRGAGNILGSKQHGQITAVGLSMYSRLLNHAVEEMRSGQKIDEIETTVDLPIAALIPVDFIKDERERIKLYQKIAGFSSIAELFNYKDNLKRDIKDIPEKIENLLLITEVKLLAHEAGIIKVESQTIRDLNYDSKTRIVLVFKHIPDSKSLVKLLEKQPHWRVQHNQLKIEKEDLGEDWVGGLKEAVKVLGM